MAELGLNPCRKCGAAAVEHIRGEFHKNTRNDLAENNIPGKPLVDMDASIEDDYRIACSKVVEEDFVPARVGDWTGPFKACDNFGPWTAPTLKEVAKAKARWNELNPVKT